MSGKGRGYPVPPFPSFPSPFFSTPFSSSPSWHLMTEPHLSRPLQYTACLIVMSLTFHDQALDIYLAHLATNITSNSLGTAHHHLIQPLAFSVELSRKTYLIGYPSFIRMIACAPPFTLK